MRSTLIALALAAATLGVSAQTLKSVQVEPTTVAAGGEVTVTAQ